MQSCHHASLFTNAGSRDIGCRCRAWAWCHDCHVNMYRFALSAGWLIVLLWRALSCMYNLDLWLDLHAWMKHHSFVFASWSTLQALLSQVESGYSTHFKVESNQSLKHLISAGIGRNLQCAESEAWSCVWGGTASRNTNFQSEGLLASRRVFRIHIHTQSSYIWTSLPTIRVRSLGVHDSGIFSVPWMRWAFSVIAFTGVVLLIRNVWSTMNILKVWMQTSVAAWQHGPSDCNVNSNTLGQRDQKQFDRN